jgi:hypothetical protein
MDVYEVQDSSRKEEGLMRSKDETSSGSPSYGIVGGRMKACRSKSGGGGGRTLLPLKMAMCRSLGMPPALQKLPLPVSSSLMVAEDVCCCESSASLPWISR